MLAARHEGRAERPPARGRSGDGFGMEIESRAGPPEVVA